MLIFKIYFFIVDFSAFGDLMKISLNINIVLNKIY